jgi:hypothetical protein
MTFYSEATMQQSLALLERIFQTSRGIHLLFNTVCGLPNQDLARPDHILNNPVETLAKPNRLSGASALLVL